MAVERIKLVRGRYEALGDIGVNNINRVESSEIGDQTLALEVSEWVRTNREYYGDTEQSASTVVMFRRLNVVVEVESYGSGVLFKQQPSVNKPAIVARRVDRLLVTELERARPDR